MTTTNTCKTCGCQDSFMVSPAPCPTPVGCPTPQPCSEIFDAQCVRYTGLPLSCTTGVQTFNANPNPKSPIHHYLNYHLIQTYHHNPNHYHILKIA